MENMEGRRGGVWGGARERLHSQTAISRDEAFLNKQKDEEEEDDQYCVSLPSGLISVALEYLFSAPLFSFSPLL